MANPSVIASDLAQIVRAFAIDTRSLHGDIADAYHEAALAGLNMRRVVEHLDTLRSAASTSTDCFDLFIALDDQVGLAMDELPLAQVVRNLRQKYVDRVIAAVRTELTVGSSIDDNAVQRYAAALGAALSYWRKPLVLAILDRTPPHVSADPVISRTNEWRHYIEQEQLGYLPHLCRRLAACSVDRTTRVRLTVLAARIETYQFEDTGSAKELLADAAGLAPQDPQVVAAYGEYWLQMNEKEKARDAFEKAIELNGRFAPAYVAYGDLFSRQSDWAAAEEQYDRAIRAQPGDVAGYRSLIDVYGQPVMFGEHVDRLQLLVERAVFIDPDNAVDVYGAAATACQQNGRYDEGRAFLGRAIEMAPAVATPHLLLSRSYSEQQNYSAAEAEIRRALELAPNLAVLHFELGTLYEQQGRSSEALVAYEEAVRTWSPWIATFAPLAAEMKWRLGRQHEAHVDLLRLLSEYPRGNAILTKLHEFVTRYYTDLNEATIASAILHRIREIRGSEYEASYRNRLGVIFHHIREYALAAEQYALASSADPATAVYHSNLALAYRQLRQWDSAREKLAEALKLTGDQTAHDRELANILNDQALAHIDGNEYSEARELYRAATRLHPEAAVLHANAAYVLERLETPGRRLPELDEAIAELETASHLAPDRSDYRQRLTDVQARRTLVARYGEPGWHTPAATTIVIEVGDALVPLVDSKGDGGTFLFDLVPSLRGRIERTTGIFVPGFHMRGSHDIPPDALRIFLDEVPVSLERFPGNPPASALIDRIEAVLLDYLHVLVGIDGADAIIRRWMSEGRLPSLITPKLADTEFFVGLARLLRTLARDGVPLVNAEVILGAVEDSRLNPADIPAVVNAVRQQLKETLPGNSPGRPTVRLPGALESMLTTALGGRVDTYNIPVRLRYETIRTIAALHPDASSPWTLVVSSPIVRVLVGQLIQCRLPKVLVLAEAELVAEGNTTLAGGVHG